ncbi:UNVERIFIED_CONTAM: hypothetical protein ABID98_001850 [Brevibacillus sp. OAP136]
MKVYDLVNQYVLSKQSARSKVRLNSFQMEYDIRSNEGKYYELGGYEAFFAAVKALESKGIIQSIKSSPLNGRVPALPVQYWILPRMVPNTWDPLQMIKLSDRINFSYYKRHPKWQTPEEWARVEFVHTFLQTVEERQWVSIEERSLELFGDEKYLSGEGSSFLKRVGINPATLKARRLGEPFVFWLRPGTLLQDIHEVLIVENLSFFHTAVKFQKQNRFERQPDIIIYGEGKKIESSFSYFFDLFPSDRQYSFRYVGDMDPEGYGIIYRLHLGFKKANIGLAAEIYEAMANFHEKAVPCDNQDRDPKHLTFMLQQFAPGTRIAQLVCTYWDLHMRIPQEVLTVETWRKGLYE